MNLFVLFGLCACAQGATDACPKADSPQAHANDSSPRTTAGQDRDADGANNGTPPSTGDAGTAELPASNASGTKRVFITSIKYSGNLGGIDGADGKCNKSATLAMLGGTWKAWMSNSNQDAVHRIKDVGPWFTVDEKTKMFDDIFDLIVKPLALDRMWLDELGNSIVGQIEVRTGTEEGKRTYYNCNEWTSSSSGDDGTSTFLEQHYTSNANCYDALPLLCVEQ
jgi:hypothetical protein